MHALRIIAIRLVACAALAALAACARPATSRLQPAPAHEPLASGSSIVMPAPFCLGCTEPPLGSDVLQAVSQRVADLKARGGACEVYGTVLEGSLASRHIVVRPFMWRVGSSLASAQALSTGEIDVAREVDPLNIGVRTLADVVHSVEHEAAHIAFAIPSGLERSEALVNERIWECSARTTRTVGTP